MTNTFLDYVLERLKEEENRERFNDTIVDIKATITPSNHIAFEDEGITGFFDNHSTPTKLYILRIAIKTIEEFEVETKEMKEYLLRFEKWSKHNIGVKENLVDWNEREPFRVYTRDQLLDALNEDNYLNALEDVWEENKKK